MTTLNYYCYRNYYHYLHNPLGLLSHHDCAQSNSRFSETFTRLFACIIDIIGAFIDTTASMRMESHVQMFFTYLRTKRQWRLLALIHIVCYVAVTVGLLFMVSERTKEIHYYYYQGFPFWMLYERQEPMARITVWLCQWLKAGMTQILDTSVHDTVSRLNVNNAKDAMSFKCNRWLWLYHIASL